VLTRYDFAVVFLDEVANARVYHLAPAPAAENSVMARLGYLEMLLAGLGNAAAERVRGLCLAVPEMSSISPSIVNSATLVITSGVTSRPFTCQVPRASACS